MVDLDALCHRCGTALPAPSDARRPLCERCASDRGRKAEARRTREANRAQRARERAWRVGAEGRYLASEVAALRRRQRNRCAACGANLRTTGDHVDHKVPLSRGGRSDARNICLLCPPCNLSKGTRTLAEFLAERERCW